MSVRCVSTPVSLNLKSDSVAGDESAQVNMRDGDTSGGDISFETPDIIVDDYEKTVSTQGLQTRWK